MWRSTLSARRLLVFVSLLLTEASLANSDVDLAPVPEWTDELELLEFPTDRSGEFRDGVAYLLHDLQVRKTPAGYDYAVRIAYRVTDRSGLEHAARISREFDPTDETLALNFIRIVREDGAVDNREDAEITVLRQEDGLEAGIIDGKLTAVVHLEDVRVGDVIDYSFSGTVTSHLWPDHYFEAVTVEWSVPLAQQRYVLSVPAELPVEARSVATRVKPKVEVTGDRKKLVVYQQDPDPIRIEASVPGEWVANGFVELSTMASWEAVADWAVPVFSVDDALPDSFVRQLDEIAAAYDRPEDRATHVLRLVQEEIRYLGIELGLGSHVPRTPAETIKNGYGDCKDKSVLLVAALKYLGIDAVPALASIAYGELLPQLPPTVGRFDHAIVGVHVDGQWHWVDPTLSHQGGRIADLADLEYGYVLPIRDLQTELEEIEVDFPELPTYQVLEEFDLPESADVGLRLRSDNTYRGARADYIRSLIARIGTKALETSYLDYYSEIYNGLREDGALTITDDLDENVVNVEANYVLDVHTFENNGYHMELPVSMEAVQNALPQPDEAERKAPLDLPFGTNNEHVVRISKPGYRLSLPDDSSTDVTGITYARSFRNDGDVFELKANLRVASNIANRDTVPAVVKLANSVAEDSELSVLLRSAVPTLSKQLGLEVPLAPDVESAIMDARRDFGNKEHIKALTAVNTLLAQHGDATTIAGYLLVFKGVVLENLDRDAAAISAFSKGFEQFEPINPEGYFRFADALLGVGQEVRAAETLATAMEKLPFAVNSLHTEWFGDFTRRLTRNGETETVNRLLVATARAAHLAKTPKIDELRWVFLEAAEYLTRNGQAPQAYQFLIYIKNPRDLAFLLASREMEPVWEGVNQLTGDNLSYAIAHYVSFTKEAANAAPDDFESQTRHLTALRLAERFDEAIEFGQPIVDDWPRIEAVGRDAYWFVNQFAYVLADAGYPEKADALFGRLVSLGVQDNGDLISMAINRASLSLNWGNFTKALEAVADIEALDEAHASDYGWGFVHQVKACALQQLGRSDEAESVLTEKLAPLSDVNPSAHAKALLCFDRLDEAAELLVKRLHDEDDRRYAIASFIEPSASAAQSAFYGLLVSRAAEVRAKPVVQSAVEDVARPLSVTGPLSYWTAF